MAANRPRQLVLTKFMKEHSEEHTWDDEHDTTQQRLDDAHPDAEPEVNELNMMA